MGCEGSLSEPERSAGERSEAEDRSPPSHWATATAYATAYVLCVGLFQHILEREEKWNEWKNGGCEDFTKRADKEKMALFRR